MINKEYISGRNSTYKTDNYISISDIADKTKDEYNFDFKNCICVFHIIYPDENNNFIRKYIAVDFFEFIDRTVFDNLNFKGYSPNGFWVIFKDKDISQKIIEDIKNTDFYIG